MKKSLLSILLIIAIVCSAVPAGAAASRSNFTVRNPHCLFKDLPADHWARADIHNAYWLGLIQGKDAYTYQPDEFVSMLTILKVALRASDIYHGGGGYLPIEHGYELLYKTCEERGLLKGVEGYDDPKDLDKRYANRRQMAQLFMNILPESELPDINNKAFAPSDIKDASLMKFYTAGIWEGKDGVMDGWGMVTNAEVAVAISRIVGWRVTWDIVVDFSTVLGEYTTKYDQSQIGRSYNIALAASSINEVIIPSERSFSFNDVVGSRNAARGYKEATVIQEGVYTAGIGGGVCQVSTTLFNAVLLANLKITERFAHSLPASYVPYGMDATVYYGALDFRFTNPLPTPVKIVTTTGNGEITVKILGSPSAKPSGVALNVVKDGKYYVLKRTVNGEVNYTTKSSYSN